MSISKKELIEKIEDINNINELQHPEFYSGYSHAINDVVDLVKKLDLHGVIVPSCPECKSDDYDNIRGICNEEGCILCD